MEFKKKWGIMTKALAMMVILLVVRTIIEFFGFDVVPINTVAGAFISGAIFTIAIIFTGTFLADQRMHRTADASSPIPPRSPGHQTQNFRFTRFIGEPAITPKDK
jgi:hypothetical protein